MTNSVESGRYRSQPSRPTVKMSGAFHAPPLTVPPVFAKGQSKRESPKNEPHLRSSNLNFFSPTIGVQSKNVFPPISILGEEQIVFKSGLVPCRTQIHEVPRNSQSFLLVLRNVWESSTDGNAPQCLLLFGFLGGFGIAADFGPRASHEFRHHIVMGDFISRSLQCLLSQISRFVGGHTRGR